MKRSPTPSKRRKIVVGGTHNAFRAWVRNNRMDLRHAVHVTFREQIMGLELKPQDIVRLGPISDAMELELKLRIR